MCESLRYSAAMTDILQSQGSLTGHHPVSTLRSAARLDSVDPGDGAVHPAPAQPYAYHRRELVEPDWRRFPGWRQVTAEQWRSAQWQRAHCVKNPRQLRAVVGDLLDDEVYADLEADQAQRATMSMLVPPQMVNTMLGEAVPRGPGSWSGKFRTDPVRRYMLPMLSDRRTTGTATRWPRATPCTSTTCGWRRG